MKHRPVVTNFKVKPVTYPDGHWMNRFWGPIARGVIAVFGNFPIYRHILRTHPAARKLLDSGEPVILACIHQDAFDCFNGLPRLLQDRQLTAMVSLSRDGGLIAMALRMLGYDIVRGSSSRGGGEGLMMLRSALASGASVVMVCDGPKAPLADVKPGVVRLAASAEVPILPVRAWGLNRACMRHNWTKASISMPFLPIACAVGAPIRVPAGTDDTRPYQIEVAQSIEGLARWTSYWANGPYTAPFKVASS